MPDYKADILKTIGDVVRVQSVIAGAAQKKLPITSASKGWKMPNMVPPSSPADGAHIYVVDGEMRWKSETGQDYSLVPVEVPVASAVANAGNIVSGNAPEDYNDVWGQHIYESLVDVKDQLNALLAVLRAAGLLDT